MTFLLFQNQIELLWMPGGFHFDGDIAIGEGGSKCKYAIASFP